MPEEIAVALEVLKLEPKNPALFDRAERIILEYLGGFIPAEETTDG